VEGPGAWLASYPQWVDPLLDIGDGRVAAMDAAGIDTAVLSLTAPGVEQLEGPEAVKLARESNDIPGNAVREHSGRLAGFATLLSASPTPRRMSWSGPFVNTAFSVRSSDLGRLGAVAPADLISHCTGKSSHFPAHANAAHCHVSSLMVLPRSTGLSWSANSSCRRNFCTFPEPVSGKSSTTAQNWGALNGARRARQ
jgi:hypothetical protein